MPKVHIVNIILHMGLMEEHMVEHMVEPMEGHKECMEDIITMDHMEEALMLSDQTPTLPKITADYSCRFQEL